MQSQTDTRFTPQNGYMTEAIRQQYIAWAIAKGLLPQNAQRLAPIVSLQAPEDTSKPIQFWQLYSVLGTKPVLDIVSRFYTRVFADEAWFKSVFERIGTRERHISTQAAMWVDVMGGGQYYHGGEFRLNFHHTHNAMELMTDAGAARWIQLMRETLDEPGHELPERTRVRPAINTFLTYFMGKYAEEFKFANAAAEPFGAINPPWRRRLNFLSMTSEQVEALSDEELIEELTARRIDTSALPDKQALVQKALSL